MARWPADRPTSSDARAEKITPKVPFTSRRTASQMKKNAGSVTVRGAFAEFDHDHYFRLTDSGTRIVGIFEYHAPLGWLGWLAERLFLSRYMRRFLLLRLHELKAIAESTTWDEFLPASGLTNSQADNPRPLSAV
jgi:ligand-binding SRPBCC domain-containing protein